MNNRTWLGVLLTAVVLSFLIGYNVRGNKANGEALEHVRGIAKRAIIAAETCVSRLGLK